jgi:Rrf2 family iron-sulfur cluster assembly transcriptional regulator
MISRSAEYGLRIMAFLALRSDGSPIRARDIAEEVNIPSFYLSKILRRMVAAKLLNATKGHGGGFVIARPPEKISFLDVLEAIEGDISKPMCVFGWDACSDKAPCALHNRWKECRAHFLSWAKQTTLTDLQKDLAKLPLLGGFHEPTPRKSKKSPKK